MSFGKGTIVYIGDEQYEVVGSTHLLLLKPIEYNPNKVIWVMHEDLIEIDGKFILDTSKYNINNRKLYD